MVDEQGQSPLTIDDDEWHHIAVTLYGKNGSLSSTVSCSFFVDGQQLNTCQDSTATIQDCYEQALENFGSTGFMGWNASDAFNFSTTANNPLAVDGGAYRGDEFLTIGGNGHTTGNQTNNFSGSMSNITFWTRNLSAEEINTLYNSGSPCDITCSAPYATNPSALHVWLPMGNAQNPLSGDQVDVINATNPTAFTSASHAIWDASGKQNHYWVISNDDPSSYPTRISHPCRTSPDAKKQSQGTKSTQHMNPHPIMTMRMSLTEFLVQIDNMLGLLAPSTIQIMNIDTQGLCRYLELMLDYSLALIQTAQ